MFWNQLEKLLLTNNMSQADLSKACNIKTATISQWKIGHQPTIKMLLNLSSFFNISVDFLLGNTKIQFKTKDYTLNEEEQQVIEYYKKADKYKQNIIKELLHMQ